LIRVSREKSGVHMNRILPIVMLALLECGCDRLISKAVPAEQSRIGSKSLEEWVALSSSQDPLARVDAARGLGQFSNPKTGVLEVEKWGNQQTVALMRLAHDPNESVRKRANESLAKLGFDGGRFASHLSDPNKEIRLHAAMVLSEMGAYAADAVPSLTTALRDEDQAVRECVALTLGRIGSPAKDAIPELVKALGSEGAGAEAAFAILKLRPERSRAIPLLVALLHDPEPDRRAQAAWTLGQMNAEARAAIPRIIESLSDKDPSVRKAAAGALGQMGDAVVTGPHLVKAFSDVDGRVRAMAAWAIGELRIADLPSLEGLLRLLQDREATVRGSAAEAMGKLGAPAGPDAVQALGKLLMDKSQSVREIAARALGQMGPGARRASHELERALHDVDPSVRDAAARALKKLVP
jgi:HEAT repeat protein